MVSLYFLVVIPVSGVKLPDSFDLLPPQTDLNYLPDGKLL